MRTLTSQCIKHAQLEKLPCWTNKIDPLTHVTFIGGQPFSSQLAMDHVSPQYSSNIWNAFSESASEALGIKKEANALSPERKQTLHFQLIEPVSSLNPTKLHARTSVAAHEH
jgi:hypothetical protein